MDYLTVDIRDDMDKVNEYLSGFLAPLKGDQRVNDILIALEKTRGKQIRPRLLLAASGFGSFSCRNRERILFLAALLEMIHMASLVHDDIVDDSPLRRGARTVQSRFGKDMAVYTGDLLLTRVMKSLFEKKMLTEGKWFSQAIESMCAGEIGQYDCMFRERVAVKQYMDNIYGKTAVLFELALKTGAYAGGCDSHLTGILQEIGKKMGLLFQIRDDLLDICPDQGKIGKPLFMDFREGIWTLPVLFVLEEEEGKSLLQPLMKKVKAGIFEEKDQKALYQILEGCGGIDRAKEKVESQAGEIQSLILRLPDRQERTGLTKLVEILSDI